MGTPGRGGSTPGKKSLRFGGSRAERNSLSTISKVARSPWASRSNLRGEAPCQIFPSSTGKRWQLVASFFSRKSGVTPFLNCLGKAERHSPSLRQKIKPDSANKKKPFPAFVLRKIVRINQIKNIAIPKKSRKPNSCLDSVCGSLFMLSLLP